MSSVLLVLRLILAVVFAIAGLAKLADRAGARRAFADFGAPEWAVSPLAFVLPAVELAIAVALVPSASARWAAAAAVALLGLFALAIAVNLARGRKPDCHCFGQLHSAPAGVSALLRNLALAAMAAVVVWQPSGGLAISGWELALFAACVVLGAQSWFFYQLVRQNGRILSRLATLEAGVVAPVSPAALAPATGSPAPYFSLPSLDAEAISLTSLLEAGRPVLLAFITAGCGPCTALLPRLADWQRRGTEALTVVVVSPADAAENASWAREHGLDRVVLQPGIALSSLYGVRATPSALLIDTEGRIASSIAEGSDAITELAESRLPAAGPGPVPELDDPRAPAELAAAVLAGSTAALAVSAAVAPAAGAASPERDAILALIEEAKPRLTTEAKALQKASKRYSAKVTPTASSRRGVSRAIAGQVAELRSLYEAVASSAVTTDLGRDAQALALETIQLTVDYLTKLDRAINAKGVGAALRSLKASRKALDESLQTGVNARAALTRP